MERAPGRCPRRFEGGFLDREFDTAGAAILNFGSLSLTNCVFRDNAALGEGGIGGAIASIGTLRVNDCAFEGNMAQDRGGAIFNVGVANINRTTFLSNTASSGGAVASSQGMGGVVFVFLTIRRSLFEDNQAIDGRGAGGALSLDHDAVISNTTFSANQASNNGGAIFVEAGKLSLTHVTMTENRADIDINGSGSGGGLFVTTGSDVKLTGSVIAGNLVGQPMMSSPFDVMGRVLSSSRNNLLGSSFGLTGISNGANGNRVGTPENPLDARLAPLAENGGPTRSHALHPGSPALDAGPTIANGTDQRGKPRKAESADADTVRRADIGAVEMQVDVEAIANLTFAANVQGDIRRVNLGTLANSATTVITVESSNPSLLPNPTIETSGNSKGLLIQPDGQKHGTAIITVKAVELNQVEVVTSTFTVPLLGAGLSNTVVAEHSPVGTVVGTLSATVAAAGPVTFEFVFSFDIGLRIVNGNQIVVSNPAMLDFEDSPFLFFTLRVSAGGVPQFIDFVRLNFTNIVEAPVHKVPTVRLQVPKAARFFSLPNVISIASAEANALISEAIRKGRFCLGAPKGRRENDLENQGVLSAISAAAAASIAFAASPRKGTLLLYFIVFGSPWELSLPSSHPTERPRGAAGVEWRDRPGFVALVN